jgi:hypothetical protein
VSTFEEVGVVLSVLYADSGVVVVGLFWRAPTRQKIEIFWQK